MKRNTTSAALLLSGLLALPGCVEDTPDGDVNGGDASWRGQTVETLRLGASDNAEVVKALPGVDRVLLISSKARKVSLISTAGGSLSSLRERSLFSEDSTESELTHVDVSSDGAWAVATRTLLETDADGAQTRCGGELVFIDVSDADTFGDVIGTVEVGPMPDSVDISDDGAWVVSANERDGLDAWGKCEVEGATASISVVDLSGGPAQAVEAHRVEMIDGDTGPREPESVVFAPDSDLIVATLQDSHEVAMFRRSELTEGATSDDISIIALPVNSLGAGAWPDGVGVVPSASGPHFLVAGEWNDTFTVLDAEGAVVAHHELSTSNIPETFPRVVDEGSPYFSPDSVTSFTRDDRVYAALTLRHAGAVAVYELTDPSAPAFVQVISVGEAEQGGADEDGSTIRPEGIAAAADGRFIVTANEEESSISLITPLP